jgi:hypothetical protein
LPVWAYDEAAGCVDVTSSVWSHDRSQAVMEMGHVGHGEELGSNHLISSEVDKPNFAVSHNRISIIAALCHHANRGGEPKK